MKNRGFLWFLARFVMKRKFPVFEKAARHLTEKTGILGCKQKLERRFHVFTCTFQRKITPKPYFSEIKKQVWNLTVESTGFCVVLSGLCTYNPQYPRASEMEKFSRGRV